MPVRRLSRWLSDVPIPKTAKIFWTISRRVSHCFRIRPVPEMPTRLSALRALHGKWAAVILSKSKLCTTLNTCFLDNYETIKATEILAKEGFFIVMPYMYPDLNAARDLVNAGAQLLLASPIGSNKGLATKEFIQILIDEIDPGYRGCRYRKAFTGM